MKNINELKFEELKQGYVQEKKQYHCVFCERQTNIGEVYQINNRFFEAEQAMKQHIKEEHGSVFKQLVDMEKKDNTLTEVQKQIISYFYEGKSDKEIMNLTNNSSSTIRQQRFLFKEKARHAKIFLALYELVDDQHEVEDFMEFPEELDTFDDRFLITTKEEQKLLDKILVSENPLKIKRIPTKEKEKVIILKHIANTFDRDKSYSEKEINEQLKQIYEEDYVAIRRHLIEYQFFTRNNDGSSYRRIA